MSRRSSLRSDGVVAFDRNRWSLSSESALQRPKKTKKSPAPAFHAASKAVRRELWNAYALFVAAYRDAAEKLRAGIRDVKFPRGSFPPPLPFVAG